MVFFQNLEKVQIIEEIKKIIQENDYSVARIAREANIKQDRLYKWLDNRGAPKVADTEKLVKWLNDKLGKTTNEDFHSRAEFSEKAITSLIETNKLQAEANRLQSEANRLIAESNYNISRKFTADVPQANETAVDYKLGQIVLLLGDMASGKKYRTKAEAVEAFHKQIFGIPEKNEVENK